MNIQEAKALALEAFKKELKEPGWELYEHGIAKGPWVAFPGKSEQVPGASGFWRYEGANILFRGETIAYGDSIDQDTVVNIRSVLDDTAAVIRASKNQQLIDTIQHYLSKHPLEAP